MAATSATVTAVVGAATSTALLPANGARYAGNPGPSVVITNDSTAILYVIAGDGTPSSSNYTWAMDGKGTVGAVLTISGYRGALKGIWASATGNALVTEFT